MINLVESATLATVAHEMDALEYLRAQLGTQAILNAEEASRRFGFNMLGVQRSLKGAVLARDASMVRETVLAAQRQGLKLYPISTGRNWGYGSALPVSDDCIILDLSSMNRIVAFDAELGLVTVEPGVTQQDLADYLDARALPFMVPTTGAGPHASLLGNALERGYGIAPASDHFGAVTSLEAVLPDGQIYRSALCESGGSRVDKAFKWGLGPYLDGLFTQGNFGIVTQVTIALARQPERIEAFFFSLKDDASLESAVDAVRRVLRDLPGLVGGVNLMNARRMLSMCEAYPLAEVPPSTAMREDVVARLCRKNALTAWTIAGALYGPGELVSVARKRIARILKPLATRTLFVSPERARLLADLCRRLPLLCRSKWANLSARLEEGVRNMAGRPSPVALSLAYWKARRKSADARLADPAKDGSGLMWYAPLVPLDPTSVQRFVAFAHEICLRHGIEPLLTLTSVSERCFDATLPILFDKQDPKEVLRAHTCYRELFEAGRSEGFVPYRLGIHAMESTVPTDAPCADLARAIKNAIDPCHLLAPGRYIDTRSPLHSRR